MRLAFAVVLVLGVATMTFAQPPKDPEPRYGVKARLKQYPQATPKQALRSALETIEKADYAYLAAHLLDAKFVEDAVNERMKLYEAGAEKELAQLRDFQRANPDKVSTENRVPQDPKAFRDMAAARARDRAFKLLQRDIEQKLTDDPQALRDLRRLSRDGMFTDADPAATVTHPEVKNRTLHFKKIDNRWYLENRQAEEKKEP
jgi:hypothetical protein